MKLCNVEIEPLRLLAGLVAYLGTTPKLREGDVTIDAQIGSPEPEYQSGDYR